MTNSKFELKDGKVVEISTNEIEHNPQELLASLIAIKESRVAGRDKYLLEVNEVIDDIQSKIDSINEIINIIEQQ